MLCMSCHPWPLPLLTQHLCCVDRLMVGGWLCFLVVTKMYVAHRTFSKILLFSYLAIALLSTFLFVVQRMAAEVVQGAGQIHSMGVQLYEVGITEL